MRLTSHGHQRRQWLARAAGSGLGLTTVGTAWAQSGNATGGNRPAPRMVQLMDMSATQQELSRDYSTGLRLAWATATAQGKALSRVVLQTISISGGDAQMREVVAKLAGDPSVLALVGTVGDRLAVSTHQELQRLGWAVPHIGPWMADTRHDGDAGLANLFASRRVQLQSSIATVRGMGIEEICALYASSVEHALYDSQLAQAAQVAGLRLKRLVAEPGQALGSLSAQLPASSGMVLSLSTSAELALLTQALSRQGEHRFVLALGDVDVSTLMQLAPGRGVPVILSQVVPHPGRSQMPAVMEYRTQLKALYDEAPSPVSLAGYLAGLYAGELLRTGPLPSREALLAEVGRHNAQDLKGWRVDFRDDRRGSRFVTPTLLTADGRLVG